MRLSMRRGRLRRMSSSGSSRGRLLNHMTGQYAWWAIGIVLVVAYLVIGMMGGSHEGATVVIQ